MIYLIIITLLLIRDWQVCFHDKLLNITLYLTQTLLEVPKMKPLYLCSDISKAILKLVYQSGITSSGPQTVKSVDFWCKLLSPFIIAEPQEWCSELFSSYYSGVLLLDPTREGLEHPPPQDSPPAQLFFSLLHSSKNRHPLHTAGYSTALFFKTYNELILKFKIITNLLKIS